ncbi:MAG: DUF5131 family protein [Bacteroidota bacterium]
MTAPPKPASTDEEPPVGETASSKKKTAQPTKTRDSQAQPKELDEKWPDEVEKALRSVPKEHRAAVKDELRALTDDLEERTAQDVLDAYEGLQAAYYEGGIDGPDDVGLSAEVEAMKRDDTEDSNLITDLDILDDDLALEPKLSRGRQFIGAETKKPLLICLPVAVTPKKLTEDIPPDTKVVISTVTEFARAGGPMAGGRPYIEELRAAARDAKIKRMMQRTTKAVDWARYTSNPLTGCWHSCRNVFCYAAGIAARLFAQGFVPTLYPTRLDHLKNARVPDVSKLEHDEAWRERSVFCVSMGDLFGKWVPNWYVELVLEEVRQHPEWFCFFLTKDPGRLAEFSFPSNAAIGMKITGENVHHRPISADEQAKLYRRQATELGKVDGAAFTWLSLEPFRGEVHDLQPFFDAGIQMLAMGGQARTMYAPAKQPEMRWVESVRTQVRRAGIHLFEKENLIVKPKEIPFPTGLPMAT